MVPALPALFDQHLPRHRRQRRRRRAGGAARGLAGRSGAGGGGRSVRRARPLGQLRTITATMREGVIAYDMDLRLTFVNPAFERLTG